jgi:hypothetical protein
MSLNFAVAVTILVLALVRSSSVLALNPFGTGRQEMFMTLLLVLVFSLFVEIPGFFLNRTYDKKQEDALQEIVDVLLDVRLSPTSINRTRLQDLSQSREAILGEGHLGKFLSKCAAEFVTVGNADNSLLNVLTERVLAEQSKVVERSKHPFPALIQLLSLTGVAFVLGEILAVLRQR